jgi:hypothetical protein
MHQRVLQSILNETVKLMSNYKGNTNRGHVMESILRQRRLPQHQIGSDDQKGHVDSTGKTSTKCEMDFTA